MPNFSVNYTNYISRASVISFAKHIRFSPLPHPCTTHGDSPIAPDLLSISDPNVRTWLSSLTCDDLLLIRGSFATVLGCSKKSIIEIDRHDLKLRTWKSKKTEKLSNLIRVRQVWVSFWKNCWYPPRPAHTDLMLWFFYLFFQQLSWLYLSVKLEKLLKIRVSNRSDIQNRQYASYHSASIEKHVSPHGFQHQTSGWRNIVSTIWTRPRTRLDAMIIHLFHFLIRN